MKRSVSIKRSALSGDKLQEVIYDMVIHIIQNEVLILPHIAWVSVMQILWGVGAHWKKAPEDLQAGLLAHAGVRRPTDRKLLKWEMQHGYRPYWPPPDLTDMVLSIMRNRFLKPSIKGREWSELNFFCGKGYIREDGTLDQNKTRGISGYFIHSRFKRHDHMIENYFKSLSRKQQYLRVQWWRNVDTWDDAILEQIESAKQKLETSNRQLKRNDHARINVAVDSKLLTWRKRDDDSFDEDAAGPS